MKIYVKSDCRGMSVENTIDKVFEDRGIEDSWHFLHPVEDDLLPLTDLKNIKKASELVITYANSNKRIGVHADVDVDGITSGTIIYRYLKDMGVTNLDIFINNGKAHGLQGQNLEQYKKCDLLIIVDSLDNSIENYKNLYEDSNITDVIVLDHHAINSDIPYDEWVVLVSSQRDYDNPQLSGAGVCMKFILYLDQLRGKTDANKYYDLAASGIVADVMDISVPENRYIINKGLAEANNPAIQKLSGGFGFDSKAIAFSIAPSVNAGMRLNRNEYALNAFISDNAKDVSDNIKLLKKCKDDQNKEIERLLPIVEKQCCEQINDKLIIIFIKTKYGISGVIGNKIVYKYNRPIIIINDNNDEYYNGSMRAVGVENFQKIINDSQLAVAFGHENASGFSIKKSNLDAFKAYMNSILPDVGSFEETIEADIWANPEDIDEYYIKEIQKINKISGNGFQPIRIYLNGITNYEISNMSHGKHLVINIDDCKLTLVQWNFDGSWEELEDASLFNQELECVIEVQASWIGRKFMLMGVIQNLIIGGL